MENAVQSLSRFVPELILMGALALVIVADLVTQRRPIQEGRNLLTGITLVGLGAALVASWAALGAGESQSLFASMIADDGLLGVLRVVFVVASIIVLLLSVRSRELEGVRMGEMVALLLTVTAALMWMAGSVNLVMIYLSLETVSVASYLMVGYLSSDRLSNEASLKYILFGAVSTGTMLFGLSLLYGMTGTLDLYEVRAALAEGVFGPGLMLVVILVAAGIGFKIAAAPFHFWCPDVYTGAPTPVTAFLSVGPKAAGFAILIRFFYLGMGEPAGGGAIAPVGGADWQLLLMILAVITMTLGNVAALLQTNVKRLLAYSSIAHAGTMLMAACVLSVGRGAGHRGLPRDLPVHESRSLPGGHPCPPGDRKLRDQQPCRLLEALPAPDRRHGNLPVLADGHPSLRGLPGQVVRVRGGDQRRSWLARGHRGC